MSAFADRAITVGKPAPDFKLTDESGQPVQLSDYRGRPVVLYFYPKDFTSGCTKEACDFRDMHSQIDSSQAVVLGVSPDSAEMHAKFIAEYNLPYKLLADEEKQVMQLYGVWGLKSMNGKEFQGVIRSTFLIDKDGVVRKIWRKVNVQGHVEEVVHALEGLK